MSAPASADDAFPRHADPRVDAWVQHAKAHDSAYLSEILADDAVFHSPVVHTPQAGKARAHPYLDAAGHVFANTGFRYVRILHDGDEAMLEFEADMNGIHINGIDIIRWNAEGKISDFKVMVRPFKAVQMLWDQMAAQLKAAEGAA